MTISAADFKTGMEADFGDFDDQKTVTYRPRRTNDEGELDPSNTDITGLSALRRQISYKALQLGVIGDGSAVPVTWHILRSDLGGVQPKQGDQIIQESAIDDDAAGTVWTIQLIELQTLGTRYRFSCTKGAM